MKKPPAFQQSVTDAVELPQWPGGARAAVSFSYDLDADVGDSWRKMSGFLTTQSDARFGAGRALERLLRIMDDHKVKSTFFVPGEIAQLYPREVKAVMAAGHEVGHHGHIHLAIDRIREIEQKEEMVRGLEALDSVGVRPSGYRCPGWDLTAYTLDLLVKEGFHYDSSCMGDDRPYWLAAGTDRLLEMPVHWSLDDWVFFRFANGNIYDGGGTMSDPDACLNTWKREVLNATEEGRHVVITMHPEVMGRGYRAHMLAEFIGWLQTDAKVWIGTLKEVADLVAPLEQRARRQGAPLGA